MFRVGGNIDAFVGRIFALPDDGLAERLAKDLVRQDDHRAGGPGMLSHARNDPRLLVHDDRGKVGSELVPAHPFRRDTQAPVEQRAPDFLV